MTVGEPAAALASVVGGAHIRAATPADAVRGVTPAWVVEPEDDAQIANVLRAADTMGIAVIPRGGGTKLDWGNPPIRADVVLSTRRLARVVDHAWADLTVVVEAGCTMAALQDALRARGQRVALDVLWPGHATVGGVLAANDSGALRLRFGGLRDLIIGITIALPDGTIASSGGRVVKNVAGYDLPKLATGALGTLGVITRAVFRLHPLPRGARTLSLRAVDTTAMQRLLDRIQDSTLAHSALQVRTVAGEAPLVDILFEGSEAGFAAQSAQLRASIGAEATDAESASPAVWLARQTLWAVHPDAMVIKLSVPLTEIASTIERARALTGAMPACVFYANGLGWMALPDDGSAAPVEELRACVVGRGGSLVVLRTRNAAIDTWGGFGDAAGLMRQVRRQFDPAGTLNPGRFIDPAAVA